MKKLLCLILAVLMTLSLCACGGGEGDKESSAKAPEGLRVGYAREKIMPNMGKDIPMGGYGNTDKRLAQGMLDYLYLTCVAFADGDQTVLLYTQDLIGTNKTQVARFQEELTKQTGIPAERILVCSTHSHSTPAQTETEYPGIQEYNDTYMQAGIKAGLDAIADLAPATMYGGSVEVEGMNFVRHYLMNDGTYFGSNFGSSSSGYKDHACDNDPHMGLLKIEREGDKEDILLMNWAAHPCFTGGIDKYDISADYVGTTRMAFEAATGMKFAFFLGPAGNQNTNSLMLEDKHFLDNNTYGQALAQHAIDALPTLEKIEGTGISTTCKEITYARNKADLDKLPQAQEVYALFSSTGDRGAGNALAVQYGLSSVYHASSIIARSRYSDTGTFKIYATRIGDFGFVNAPYEMFAASAVHIRTNSPYENTFVITCSTDGQGYFPTKEAFDYGCYESFTCGYARGIAEDTAAEFVTLLNEIQ